MIKLFQDVSTKVRVYNFDAIKDEVTNYLKSNGIAGDKYICTDVLEESFPDVITVKLERLGEFSIDEDFDSDENWEAFCNDMAKKLEVRIFSEPYWYHPK